MRPKKSRYISGKAWKNRLKLLHSLVLSLGSRVEASIAQFKGSVYLDMAHIRWLSRFLCLGTPVVPFILFFLGVSLLKLNNMRKGTLIIKRLLGT